MNAKTLTQPVFCVNCKHYNTEDDECHEPRNVNLVINHNLVTGIVLPKPVFKLKDSSANVSRSGDTSQTNCGYQGGWYEQNPLIEMAKEAISGQADSV